MDIQTMQPPSTSNNVRALGTKLVCAVAGIAGAIAGVVIGAVGYGLLWGFLGASTFGLIGIPLAFTFPLAYFLMLASWTVGGALMGGFGGMFEGAEYAYKYAHAKLDSTTASHHPSSIAKIQSATMNVFNGKVCQNMHLFFSNKTLPCSKEKNNHENGRSSFQFSSNTKLLNNMS